MTEQRFKKLELGAWIGMMGNLALALMKGLVGYFSSSHALIADALHSASDAAATFAVLFRPRTAGRQMDEQTRFEREKTHSIASIIISAIILVLGIETGVSSGKAMYEGVPTTPQSIVLIAIALSIVLKEAMFQIKYRVGTKLSHQTLMNNERERRSDLFSSAAAFIGSGGAILGHYLGNTYMYYLDPIAGIFIAWLILRMGFRLILDSIASTMERVLHQEDAAKLLDTVQRIKGVISVEDLRARELGHYVVVDAKISVDPSMTIQEGHEIAKTVKQTLMKRFIHVSDVFIHVNPYDPGYPYKSGDSGPEDFPTVLH